MFNLMKLFNNQKANSQKPAMDKEAIAEFLKTSPEKLAEFESYYKTEVLENTEPDSNNVFGINAKKAAAMTKTTAIEMSETLNSMVEKIVTELQSMTAIYTYDGEKTEQYSPNALPDNYRTITADEIKTTPMELQPQLTGTLMKKDVADESCRVLMFYLKEMQTAANEKTKREMYHRFRQGLDILDLDPLTYAMIDQNQNSMGHWLPQLIYANSKHGFFKIPKTTIARVPITLLQLTRLPYESLTPTTKAILNKWAVKTFKLDEDKDYFVKTGTYSSKFDFRNCHVHGANEVKELGEYLLYIHFAALQMASPLSQPCIYGASTTTEWVVREFIDDVENNPVIYKGLPLHTEYRVFIDCDTKEVLGCNPYWEPETMKTRFAENRDGHDIHDYISYKAHEDVLMGRYEQNKKTVTSYVRELLPDLNLSGQWSLDIMQNGNDFWLIDMALAETSAGYDKAVDTASKRPTKENWLPVIK